MKIIEDLWNQKPEAWTLDVKCGSCNSRMTIDGNDVEIRQVWKGDGYGDCGFYVSYFGFTCGCCDCADSNSTKLNTKAVPMWVRKLAEKRAASYSSGNMMDR